MISVSAGQVRIKFDHDTIRKSAIRTSDESALRAARIARARARAAARRKGRIDTGEMIRSIGYQRRGEPSLQTTYEVGSPLKYLDWQEDGTKPIVPVRAKVLRFKPKGSGVFIFAMRTRGVPAGHFMKEARNAITQADFLPPASERLG